MVETNRDQNPLVSTASHPDRVLARIMRRIHRMRRKPAPPATRTRPIPVTAFVDWTAQMHNTPRLAQEPREMARQTLARTARAVEKVLAEQAPNSRFSVGFRLYHGWYKGWEPTDNLRAIITIAAETDFASLSRKPSVTFSPTVRYGHTLLSALPERQHIRPPIHLPNTWRRPREGSQRREKMVDTALAADILSWARATPSEWALVLAEDDDCVPPVFTAEAWIKPHGGRAFIVRTRSPTPYLKLDGLWMKLQ